MQLTLRNADVNDLNRIHQMLFDANLPKNDCEEHINQFLLLERNGEIIGIGGLELYGSIALMRSIVVVPTERRQGTGILLCNALMEMGYRLNVRTFYLLTESTVAYFLNLGFVIESRQNVPQEIRSTKQFSELCPSSATVMSKTLLCESP